MKHVMDMVVEYVKIFDTKGVYGDLDRGGPNPTKAWQKALAKNPESKINAYFTSEEDMNKLLEDDDFDPKPMGHDRIKDGNSEFGIGKYVQLKRKLSDVREFTDNKTGEEKSVDYGGLIDLVVWSEEEQSFVDYDYEKFGVPANGSKAKVRFESKYMRPLKIGFTEILEYVDDGESEGGF